MVNFRRNRPRKQPRSVMSSPDRIYEPAREQVQEEGVNTQPKPKRRKPFKIEYRYIGESKYMPAAAKEWRAWGAYATEKSRDTAFATLKKNKASGLHLAWEYRIKSTD